LKKRSKAELKVHFDLHKKYIKEEILDSDRFEKDEIQFNVLGRINLLPKDEQLLIEKAINKTKKFSKHIFNVCIAYDGQDEIVNAVKKIINKNINPNAVTKEIIKQNLYTRDIPPPDLIIRTGMNPGKRLSGFLLWDSSYAEMVFRKTYWPDYTPALLRKDINSFSNHKRRFGR
jgi:tritrans,polycis-undecaprenyl-diphosphate synthase [geranylgeranyl-diphosphate specific]